MPPPIETKFFGRDKESKQLQNVLRTVRLDKTSKIVLLSGLSGSGKTTLVETVFKNNNENDCLYGSGKFEMENVSSKPLASLSQSISALVKALLLLEADDTKKYGDLIKSTMTSEDVQQLAFLAPEINSVVPGHARSWKAPKEVGRDNSEHLKYALRLLLRTIALPDRPVVLFMDDLQWVDQTTMDFLESILSDPDIQHFVLAGAYRKEEVGNDNVISEWIADDDIDVIELQNFDLDQIQEMLTDALQTRDNVQELADLFYNRTHGNIFHFLELLDFIKSHENPKLLEYSPAQFKYTWNIQVIRQYTSLSDSIVGMIVGNIHQLPERAQMFLRRASCFGSRFDKRMLSIVTDGDIEFCLAKTIDQGFLEALSDTIIKFVHDKVFQAAIRLCPDDDRKRMRFDIGKKLLSHYCGNDEQKENVLRALDDTALFTCVDLLNIGRDYIEDDCFRMTLAKLNHAAVLRAASFSAFLASIQYAETAISLLDQKTMWDDENYEFCLELHTLLTEMCFHCGKTEELKKSAKKVFDNAKTIDDKIRAQFAFFDAKTYTEGKLDGIVSELYTILEELGHEAPKGKKVKCRSTAALKSTLRLMESYSDEDVLALPQINDRRLSSSIRFIVLTVEYLDKESRICEGLFLMSRAIEVTLKKGLCEHSPLIFALYGSALMKYQSGVAGACRLGSRVGSLAILLSEKLPTSSSVRIHTLSFTAYVNHWHKPLSLSLEPRILAYREGLRIGDLHGAFFSITMYAMEYFYSGLPLSPFVTDMKKFVEQMSSYKLHRILFINLPVYQAALNLAGKSDTILEMNTAKESQKYHEKYNWDSKLGMESYWSYGMQISFLCDEIEIAKAYAQNLKRARSKSGEKRTPWYFGQARLFFYALIAIHEFRKTGRLKHLREANKLRLELQQYVNLGSINLPHKLQIIEAELASVQKPGFMSYVKNSKVVTSLLYHQKPVSKETLKRMYDKAIATSKKSGFLQDAALCALLASKSVDVSDNRYHVMAIELLESWGATGVIKSLRGKRSSLNNASYSMGSSTYSSSGTGFRARTHFIEGIQKEATECLSVDISMRELSGS